MNVNKIQTLSKQHQSLRGFYEACIRNDVWFTANTNFISGNIDLDRAITKSIIKDVQHILRKRIAAVELEIQKEVVNET